MDTNDRAGQGDTPAAGEPSENEPTGQSPLRDQAGRARELGERWVGQLQEMIDQAGRQAGPVLRDVAAKAAELAAVAAENAGPVAHKAANVTGTVGDKLAARSKDLAADLRRAAEASRQSTAADNSAADNSAADNSAADEPKADDAPKG
jgi:hypothetical protein